MYTALKVCTMWVLFGLITSTAFAEMRIDTSQFTRENGYKRADFESHATGWMGLDKQWVQRIYVGQTASDVQVWFERMQSQYYKHKLEVLEGDWDEGLGNEDLMMIRVNTLGLLCHGSNPEQCIAKLMSLRVDTASACPRPEGTSMLEQEWLLPYDVGPCKIRFSGGVPQYTEQGILFSKLPDSIVVHNQFAESWKYIREAENFILIENTESSVPAPEYQP